MNREDQCAEHRRDHAEPQPPQQAKSCDGAEHVHEQVDRVKHVRIEIDRGCGDPQRVRHRHPQVHPLVRPEIREPTEARRIHVRVLNDVVIVVPRRELMRDDGRSAISVTTMTMTAARRVFM